VRFEYGRAVTQVGMCHCSQCRKVSGVASNAVIVVPEAELCWLAGEELRQVYRKPSGWSTTFCRSCGSPLPQKLPGAAAYWVPAGLLDDDPGLRIGGHIFVGSKAPWDEIAGDAPQLEGRACPAPVGLEPAGRRPAVPRSLCGLHVVVGREAAVAAEEGVERDDEPRGPDAERGRHDHERSAGACAAREGQREVAAFDG
jgi:hypothetical protein